MSKLTRFVSFFLVAGVGFIVLGLVATPSAAPEFMGEKKCKKCHIKDHKTWADTKHAEAFSYLDAEQQKDPECVKCCDVEAIKYVPKDLMDISLKRSKSDKVMELFALMRQSR